MNLLINNNCKWFNFNDRTYRTIELSIFDRELMFPIIYKYIHEN